MSSERGIIIIISSSSSSSFMKAFAATNTVIVLDCNTHSLRMIEKAACFDSREINS